MKNVTLCKKEMQSKWYEFISEAFIKGHKWSSAAMRLRDWLSDYFDYELTIDQVNLKAKEMGINKYFALETKGEKPIYGNSSVIQVIGRYCPSAVEDIYNIPNRSASDVRAILMKRKFSARHAKIKSKDYGKLHYKNKVSQLKLNSISKERSRSAQWGNVK